jgi:hypothetical protein
MLSQINHRLSEVISHGDHKAPPVSLAQSLMLSKEKIYFIPFSKEHAAFDGSIGTKLFVVIE